MTSFTQRGRHAFTLVEMLVVIAIIGTLMGLLLPAVQSARESGRRSACSNNLRQIGMAMSLHVDQRGAYPSGGWGGLWTGDPDRGFGRSQPGSWGYAILPSLDQQPTFEIGVDGKPDELTRTPQKEGATRAFQIAVGMFYCPTRRASATYPLTAPLPLNSLQPDDCDALGLPKPTEANRTDYAACAGSLRTYAEWGDGPGSMSLAIGNEGFHPDVKKSNGIVFQRSEVTPAMISDGLSKTYLVGEKGLDPEQSRIGTSRRDDRSMFVGDAYNVHAWTCEPPANDTQGFSGLFVEFGSAHQGSFVMAWADGSVRTISIYVDAQVHALSGARNDEQLLSGQ